ncbi:MAG: hypothetical protein ACI8ZO_000934, partial [Flavobacteriales bacterium]
MKLKVIISSIFILTMFSGQIGLKAQTVLFSENFEGCPVGGIDPGVSACGWMHERQQAIFIGAGYYNVFGISSEPSGNGEAGCFIDGQSIVTFGGAVCNYGTNSSGYSRIYYTTPHDVTNYQNLDLKFDWICMAEAGADYGNAIISPDGITWQVVGPELSDVPTVTRDETIDISIADGWPELYIGFLFTFDELINTPPGLSIDNVEITGDLTGDAIDVPSSACLDADYQLTDLSTHAHSTYSWSATGPGTATFTPNNTNQNPTVSFDTPGSYTVTLTYDGGPDSVWADIVVIDEFNLPFTEDFEFGFGFNGWTTFNDGAAVEWTTIGAGGNGGSQAAHVDHWNMFDLPPYEPNSNNLVTPGLNIKGYDSLFIEFEHSIKQVPETGTGRDTLKVYVSDDCGASWQWVSTHFEDTPYSWYTKAPAQNDLGPSVAGDWCGVGTPSAPCTKLDLTSFLGSDNLRVRFEDLNQSTSDFYLDNVNIYGVKSVVEANFNYTPDTTCLGGEVQFTDTSIEDIVSWNW